jgi:hypothetical protein
MEIGKTAAEIAILGAKDLGGTTAVGLFTTGVFDGIHESKAVPHLRQDNAEIPAFKETTAGACPVVAAVGGLEGM